MNTKNINKKVFFTAIIAYYIAFFSLDIGWKLISMYQYNELYQKIKNSKTVVGDYSIFTLFQLYSMRSLFIFLFLSVLFFVLLYKKGHLKEFYIMVSVVIIIGFIYGRLF